MLEQGGPLSGAFAKTIAGSNLVWFDAKGTYRAVLEHPDCQLIHAVRFLAMLHAIRSPQEYHMGMDLRVVPSIEVYRRSHTPKITLSHLAEAIRSLGLPDDILASCLLESHFPAFDWEPEAVWPFFLSKTDQLEKAFEPPAGDWMARYRRKRKFDNTLRVLAKFPEAPPALLGKLWEMALGPSKADRLRAQQAVAKLPDLQERLAQALTARNSQTRAVAAEWMGRLGDRRTAGPLHAAAKREKQDAALDEMLTALEKLGEPIEPYLDRDKLKAEAEKGLKKGTPPALAWFPWAALPSVHWQDTGVGVPALAGKGKRENRQEEPPKGGNPAVDAVPTETITWLLVQHYKLKSPEAGPLLQRYCAMIAQRTARNSGGSCWARGSIRTSNASTPT